MTQPKTTIVKDIPQEIMNKFRSLEESRRKGKEAVYDRILHNLQVSDLLDELYRDD